MGVLGIAALGATEVGRYALLRLLPVGLFSRIKGPQVLKERRRDSIYQLVQARPGVRFGEVGRALEIAPGSLAHHVHTLERESLVRRVRRRNHLHLFPDKGASMPLAELAGVSGALMRQVVRNPGLTQSEAARRLGVTRQALHYHVRNLRQQGLLDVTVQGRESRLTQTTGTATLTCNQCSRTFVGTGPKNCPSCGKAMVTRAHDMSP